jgi:hypothetical protein
MPHSIADHEKKASEENYNVFCPSSLLYDPNLTDEERCTFLVISNFLKRDGYAHCSDAWLAEKRNCSIEKIKKNLKSLETKGYIYRQTWKEGMYWKRLIWLSQEYALHLQKHGKRDEEFEKCLRGVKNDPSKVSKLTPSRCQKLPQNRISTKSLSKQQQAPPIKSSEAACCKAAPPPPAKPAVVVAFEKKYESLLRKIPAAKKTHERLMEVIPWLEHQIALGTPTTEEGFLRSALMEGWDCKIHSPDPERRKEDYAQGNKEFALKYIKSLSSGGRAHKIEAFNQHVEIGDGLYPSCIKYSEKGFRELFELALRKWQIL